MSSTVPWKELAVVGATTLGVCCVIGWMTGAENLQKKKKDPQKSPNGISMESQECDALIGLADAAMKKGAYGDVELAYLYCCLCTLTTYTYCSSDNLIILFYDYTSLNHLLVPLALLTTHRTTHSHITIYIYVF